MMHIVSNNTQMCCEIYVMIEWNYTHIPHTVTPPCQREMPTQGRLGQWSHALGTEFRPDHLCISGEP